MRKSGRRLFLMQGSGALAWTGAFGSFAGVGAGTFAESSESAGERSLPSAPPFKLGLVTYLLAKDWDIPTLISNCEQTGFEAVELRTTHRHGAEVTMSKPQRAEVKKHFADSRVRLLSLGTTCEYHYAEQMLVEKHIEETRRWCELAKDVGALGVKVRPNGFVEGIPHDKTLAQIAGALARCGETARDTGVEIWLEVHGEGTQLPSNIRRIMELCGHPAVGVCWNSNDTDIVAGSVKASFEMLKPWLRNVHINELWRTAPPWQTAPTLQPQGGGPGLPDWSKPYPWRELFQLLRKMGYKRYTLAEIPASCEPLRLMRYYRALWEHLAA